ncbi:MAG: Ubiquinone biosynthesis O-methyltransferase, mitochondrial [Chlamydiae bacterium]|nr:Ubiquinone biosynthesis O-methyltransferase, mitochondrial [Chlamydiota bacterium]
MTTESKEGTQSWQLGRHWHFNLFNDPKRLGFVLARYKLAASLIPSKKSVLELGCSEGLGAPILAKNALSYKGIDLDVDAIETAKLNLKQPHYLFEESDFMGKSYGEFDAVVSLDVIEHIYPEFEAKYFETIVANLCEQGIAIVGTPNITSAPYASEASQIGHVNLYDGLKLQDAMKKYFKSVFLFGINDEVMHLGYHPMAHYLFVLACGRK